MLLDSAVGSAVPCGSASPVCYRNSAIRAARRFRVKRTPAVGSAVPCVSCLILELGNPCGSAFSLVVPDGAGSSCQCGSASPVRYLCRQILDTNAARRLQFDTGSRIPMRLGVFLGGTGLPLDPVTSLARRLLFDTGSRIPMRLGVFLVGTGENRISDINAARRLLFVTRSRITMRLGVCRG